MLLATALALASAGLHAGWNLLIKTSGDRFSAAWGQFLFGGLVFLPLLLVIGLPDLGAVWPYLLITGCVHIVYVGGLVRAYDLGEFSLVYPLARGTGAVLAALGGVLLLGDHLNAAAWLAVGVVAIGLMTLAGPASGEATAIGWALLTALAIGAYTTADAAGSRASDGVAYGLASILATAVSLSVVGVARGRLPVFVESARFAWRRYLVAGVCLTVAYTLVMVAVRYAPVGYVAVLRESSVVIGAAVGWLMLGERLGGRRLASSAVVACGLALLVVMR